MKKRRIGTSAPQFPPPPPPPTHTHFHHGEILTDLPTFQRGGGGKGGLETVISKKYQVFLTVLCGTYTTNHARAAQGRGGGGGEGEGGGGRGVEGGA